MSSPAASHQGETAETVFLKSVGSREVQQVWRSVSGSRVVDLLDPLTSVTSWTFDDEETAEVSDC